MKKNSLLPFHRSTTTKESSACVRA